MVASALDVSANRVLAFVVGITAPGLRVDPLTLMGGQHAGTVHFDDVHIDGDAALMGADGSGIDAEGLRRQANTAMALLSLDLVGVAEAALQRTVDHTAVRHQFGRPIASFQAAQHLVADMHIAISAARLAARSAVFWLARGETATRETAIARMHAVTAAKLATLDAHQLHGGMGYVVDTDLHRYSERARLLATLGGGADEAAAWLTKESQ
jgi:alkylation response protein AidB-like acyl-CoA dehydrogenase